MSKTNLLNDDLGVPQWLVQEAPSIDGYSKSNINLIHLDDNDNYLYNPASNINFIGAENANLTTYKVVGGDTWPYISYKIYGNTKLWWILAQLNNISDPFDLEVGRDLMVLTQEAINLVLQSVNANKPTQESYTVKL